MLAVSGCLNKAQNRMKFLGLGLIFTHVILLHARADVLVLRTGQVVNGNVLQTNSEGGILFQREYGTFTYDSCYSTGKKVGDTGSQGVGGREGCASCFVGSKEEAHVWCDL